MCCVQCSIRYWGLRISSSKVELKQLHIRCYTLNYFFRLLWCISSSMRLYNSMINYRMQNSSAHCNYHKMFRTHDLCTKTNIESLQISYVEPRTSGLPAHYLTPFIKPSGEGRQKRILSKFDRQLKVHRSSVQERLLILSIMRSTTYTALSTATFGTCNWRINHLLMVRDHTNCKPRHIPESSTY